MKMRRLVAGSALAALLMGSSALADTLDRVRDRGHLTCGVKAGLAGFAAQDVNNEWQGFDVAYCRALAAAVLGDPQAVTFRAITPDSRYAMLASGDIDVLVRDATWTFINEVDFGVFYVGVTYFDGQGVLMPRDLGASSLFELEAPTVCVEAGSTAERTLAEIGQREDFVFETFPVASRAEAQQQYLSGGCDVYAAALSDLAATRASFADPEAHAVISEGAAKDPRGLVVRRGDDGWAQIVRWVHFALVAAEELGITSANIGELAENSRSAEITRILGQSDGFGPILGLDEDWALRAISASGNYGEIFASNIGEGTPIGLPRGLNALWTQGGLVYAPPFR